MNRNSKLEDKLKTFDINYVFKIIKSYKDNLIFSRNFYYYKELEEDLEYYAELHLHRFEKNVNITLPEYLCYVILDEYEDNILLFLGAREEKILWKIFSEKLQILL